MHFFSRNKALIAVSIGAMGVLAACGDDVTVPAPVNTPIVVNISPENATVNIGETITLSVQITGGSTTTPPTLTNCVSSNTNVATASPVSGACSVTGVASGNVTVTATVSTGQSDAAAVQVSSQSAAISNLTASPTSAPLAVGQTLQIVPNVVRGNPANTVTYGYVSSNALIASVNPTTGLVTGVGPGTATITVTANGSGAGFANATLTTGVTIQVSQAPSAILGVTVNPPSLSLGVFQKGNITTNVTTATGAPTGSVTYSSSNDAIATVAQTGEVTAVGPGNATISVRVQNPGNATLSAYDQTFTVPVTVSQPASVTINTVTQGPTMSMDSSGLGVGVVTDINNPNEGAAVDLLNTRDQIQVEVTLQPSGQNVTKVELWIADEATPAAPMLAGAQLYSSPPTGVNSIKFLVNTAEFSVNWTTGVATTRWKNGRKIISARVYVLNGAGVEVIQQTATNDLFRPDFQNIDGWATNWSLAGQLPSRQSQGAAGTSNPALNWRGGPAAEGQGNYTIAPVIYTPGLSVTTATTGIAQISPTGIGFAFNPCGTVTFVGAMPWNTRYGSTGLPGATAATNQNCSGYEHPQVTPGNIPLDAPVVTSATDSENKGYKLVSQPRGFRASSTVDKPVAVRLDYNGPQTVAPDIRRNLPAITGWVNDGFSFAANTVGSTDLGVGVMPASRSWTYSGCGNVAAPLAAGTSTPIAECMTDFTGGWNGATTIGPYNVRYTELDMLQNARLSANSGLFGVDKTNPLNRWSSTAAPGSSPFTSVSDTTIFTAAPTNILQSEFIDERAGFIDPLGTDFGAPQRTGGAVPATARSQQHHLSALGGWFPGKMTCLIGAVPAVFTPITAPNCGFTTTGVPNLMATLVDGYRPGFLLDATALSNLTNPPALAQPISGVFGYGSRINDRAGNMSVSLTRRFAIDLTQGRTTGLQIPSQVINSGNQFIATYQDSVEIRAYTVNTKFTNIADTLSYPQTLIDVRFNDVANTPASTVLGFPALMTTVYTSLELTDGAGAVEAVPTTSGLWEAIGVRTFDLGNRASLAGPGFIAGDTNQVGAILSTSVPAHQNFSSLLTGSTAVTEWIVMPTTFAQNNAPVGLKARSTQATESQNPPFTRVDFYRRRAADGVYFEYLGSVTAAASADAGILRHWTWTLPAAQFHRQVNNLSANQTSASAAGDGYIAIGVRTSGSATFGLRTPIVTGVPGPLP